MTVTLRDKPAGLQWAVLAATSLAFVLLLELTHLPAAIFLGAMAAAILLTSVEGRLKLPSWLYAVAQGLIGCLVARAINPGILVTMYRQWPIVVTCVCAVVFLSTALGGLLSRWKVLPGTTAVWGAAPGAATVMVLMAEAFGDDMRLVAFMQFLRVVMVAVAASMISRLWISPGGAVATTVWFPSVASGPFAATLAVAIIGSIVGAKLRVPAGALLLPIFVAAALSGSGILVITLPPWLLAGCYVVVGWAIGLRFTREIVIYAARLFPQILGSILALMALCGGFGYALHLATGTDVLTAYLATSPGGADSVAIIAASSKVDMSFVMAIQTARFLLVLLVGPAIARMIARWTTGGQRREQET